MNCFYTYGFADDDSDLEELEGDSSVMELNENSDSTRSQNFISSKDQKIDSVTNKSQSAASTSNCPQSPVDLKRIPSNCSIEVKLGKATEKIKKGKELFKPSLNSTVDIFSIDWSNDVWPNAKPVPKNLSVQDARMKDLSFYKPKHITATVRSGIYNNIKILSTALDPRLQCHLHVNHSELCKPSKKGEKCFNDFGSDNLNIKDLSPSNICIETMSSVNGKVNNQKKTSTHKIDLDKKSNVDNVVYKSVDREKENKISHQKKNSNKTTDTLKRSRINSTACKRITSRKGDKLDKKCLQNKIHSSNEIGTEAQKDWANKIITAKSKTSLNARFNTNATKLCSLKAKTPFIDISSSGYDTPAHHSAINNLNCVSNSTAATEPNGKSNYKTALDVSQSSSSAVTAGRKVHLTDTSNFNGKKSKLKSSESSQDIFQTSSSNITPVSSSLHAIGKISSSVENKKNNLSTDKKMKPLREPTNIADKKVTLKDAICTTQTIVSTDDLTKSQIFTGESTVSVAAKNRKLVPRSRKKVKTSIDSLETQLFSTFDKLKTSLGQKVNCSSQDHMKSKACVIDCTTEGDTGSKINGTVIHSVCRKRKNSEDVTPHKIKEKVSEDNMRCVQESVSDVNKCSVCFLTHLEGKKRNSIASKDTSKACGQCQNLVHLACPRCNLRCPNLLVLYAHLLNFSSNHQKTKIAKFSCSSCRMLSDSRFHFYKHVALSNCSKLCIFCEQIFQSHKLKEGHICQGVELKKKFKRLSGTISSQQIIQCKECKKVITCSILEKNESRAKKCDQCQKKASDSFHKMSDVTNDKREKINITHERKIEITQRQVKHTLSPEPLKNINIVDKQTVIKLVDKMRVSSKKCQDIKNRVDHHSDWLKAKPTSSSKDIEKKWHLSKDTKSTLCSDAVISEVSSTNLTSIHVADSPKNVQPTYSTVGSFVCDIIDSIDDLTTANTLPLSFQPSVIDQKVNIENCITVDAKIKQDSCLVGLQLETNKEASTASSDSEISGASDLIILNNNITTEDITQSDIRLALTKLENTELVGSKPNQSEDMSANKQLDDIVDPLVKSLEITILSSDKQIITLDEYKTASSLTPTAFQNLSPTKQISKDDKCTIFSLTPTNVNKSPSKKIPLVEDKSPTGNNSLSQQNPSDDDKSPVVETEIIKSLSKQSDSSNDKSPVVNLIPTDVNKTGQQISSVTMPAINCDDCILNFSSYQKDLTENKDIKPSDEVRSDSGAVKTAVNQATPLNSCSASDLIITICDNSHLSSDPPLTLNDSFCSNVKVSPSELKLTPDSTTNQQVKMKNIKDMALDVTKASTVSTKHKQTFVRCSTRFQRTGKQQRYRHASNFTKAMGIRCRFCSFVAQTIYGLDEHLAKLHKKKKKYFCRSGRCNHSFVLERCLEFHREVHRGPNKLEAETHDYRDNECCDEFIDTNSYKEAELSECCLCTNQRQTCRHCLDWANYRQNINKWPTSRNTVSFKRTGKRQNFEYMEYEDCIHPHKMSRTSQPTERPIVLKLYQIVESPVVLGNVLHSANLFRNNWRDQNMITY
ncbi:hypothetical protein Btru_044980 [Bulinus truncatus]|nr:hypothetical protein Btru_044980 [Bulinus truncatus]